MSNTRSDNRKPDTRSTLEPADSGHEDEKPGDPPPEIGGPKGLEPTRYGDWEQNGRCTDF